MSNVALSPTSKQYRRDGFLPLPELIDPTWAAFFCRYVQTILTAGAMVNDTQVPGSLVRHGDPLFDTLLDALAPELGERIGYALLPTYSFLRVYFAEQELVAHTDRPSCEFTVTLHLGAESALAWPVELRDRSGRGVKVELKPGDGLVYDGVHLPHWRGPLNCGWYVQVFLHFVDAEGPFASHLYDGRPALGLSVTADPN